jgi:hypothetical protein
MYDITEANVATTNKADAGAWQGKTETITLDRTLAVGDSERLKAANKFAFA